jgi:hypothetical protein
LGITFVVTPVVGTPDGLIYDVDVTGPEAGWQITVVREYAY